MVRQKLLLYQTVDKYLTQKSNSIPNATAIDFEGKKLTYDELNSRTNKLANFLISKDIGKNSRIGICLDRSFEMIICLIGILKAGAAYVPLDPDYPPGRLAIMQEDAKLSLLLCHEKFSSRFDKSNNLVFWKSIEKKIDEYSDKDPLVSINGEDVAYVIFTSGSTGRPKGISMPHRALANLIEWQLERSYFKKKANVLQYSSISFDVSFQEIATTLASGGTLYLTDDKKRRDPRILLEYLNGNLLEWAIIAKKNNTLIGTIRFEQWDHKHKHAKVGFALTKKWWGKGIMSDLLSSFIRFGFSELDFNRIQANINSSHLACINLFKKKGFQKEGILRERYIMDDDVIVFSLLKNELNLVN